MSVIVEFTTPAEDFALGRVFEEAPDTQIELDRMIPTTDAVLPFFWARGGDYKALEDALAADDDVTSAELLYTVDGRALFRVEWPPDIDGLIGNIIAKDAAILEAIGTGERWEFRLRFPDAEAMSAFGADCRDAGVDIDLSRLYRAEESNGSAPGLTTAQREVLVAALEGGYFEIPRETTLVEIAAELGISDQAVGERMRRGETKLVRALLVAESDVE